MALVRGIGGRQRGAKSWNWEGDVGTAIREGTPRRPGFLAGRVSRLCHRPEDWRHRAREEEAGLGRDQLFSQRVSRTSREAQAGARGCRCPASPCSLAPVRLPRAEPAAPHLGLKSWKRPLRFMAENFTAAASSSPRPAAQPALYNGFMVPARQPRPRCCRCHPEKPEPPPPAPPSGMPYSSRACALGPARRPCEEPGSWSMPVPDTFPSWRAEETLGSRGWWRPESREGQRGHRGRWLGADLRGGSGRLGGLQWGLPGHLPWPMLPSGHFC